jgi:hypothetical protein
MDQRLLTGVLAATLCVSCGGKERKTECSPGEVEDCTCPSGEAGTRTCYEHGWSACDCSSDAETDADAADTVDDPDGADAPDAAEEPCTLDSECDNGLYCDGAETCVEGACTPGDAVVCDDGDDCTSDECDEDADECVSTAVTGVAPAVDEARISNTTGDSEIPAVSWTGSEFGVAWLDGVLGATTIEFVRVDTSGTVVGTEARLSEGSDHFPIAQVDIAWTGSEFGVLWLATFLSDSSMRVLMRRVSGDGTALGSEIQVTDESTLQMGPSLAWTGSELGIGWSDYRVSSSNAEIYFARYAPDGSKVGSDVLIPFTGDHEMLADLVWAGSEFGLLWHYYADGPADIRFSHLSPTGTVTGTDLAFTDDASYTLTRNAVWTGSEYGVAWMQSATGDTDGAWDIHFGRISAAGAKVGTDAQVSVNPGTYDFPPVAWNGSLFGIGWTTSAGSEKEIEFALLASDGSAVGTPHAVTEDDGSESEFPSVVAAASQFALGWKDARHGSSEIYLSILGLCE